MRDLKQANQRGIAHVLLITILLLAAVAVGLATFAMVRDKDEAEDQTTSVAEDQPYSSASGAGSSLQANQRNTARKDDSSRLLSAVAEYANNNNGQLPTDFTNGAVSGGAGTTPVPVELEMYKTVTFASGKQPPVAADAMYLVTGAACGDDGGAVSSSSSRSAVVLFGLESLSGSFIAECVEY